MLWKRSDPDSRSLKYLLFVVLTGYPRRVIHFIQLLTVNWVTISDPVYIVSNCMKWITTFSTDGKLLSLNNVIIK